MLEDLESTSQLGSVAETPRENETPRVGETEAATFYLPAVTNRNETIIRKDTTKMD